jgi:glycine dehydrogenase subunit 1
MSLLGEVGLAKTALASHQNALYLANALSALPQVKLHFTGAFFHEFVLELPITAKCAIEEMAHSNIAAGYDLGLAYPTLDHCLLVCVTETKTEADLHYYVHSLQQVLRHNTNGNVAKNTAATCE